MNKKLTLSVAVFLSLLISCSTEETSLSEISEEQNSNQETNTQSNSEQEQSNQETNTQSNSEQEQSNQETNTEIADIEEVLKEFPQGAL